jgi:hypothetical protein
LFSLSCRFASGLLSVSFSLKQRSSSIGEADPADPEGGGHPCGPDDEYCDLQDIQQGRGQGVSGEGAGGSSSVPNPAAAAAAGTADTLAALRQKYQQSAAATTLQPKGTHVLHRGSMAAAGGASAAVAAGMGSSSSSSSGGHGGTQQHGRSRLGVYSAIREDEAELLPTAHTPAAAAAVSEAARGAAADPRPEQQQQQRPAGLLRVQSITSRGR